MIYGKLPVVLLSTMASNKKDATNCQIASYILKHKEEVKDMGIKDLANVCHVANSSISRFCKEIGLNDFNELKELMKNDHLYFQKAKRIEDYQKIVIDSISLANSSIDVTLLAKLVRDIHDYQNVASFGLLKAESAAIALQSDLLMQNQYIYTNINFNEQMDYLYHATENDLIIIFSYTGSYFDYPEIRSLKKQLLKPKIWLITGSVIKPCEFIDEVICFASKQDQLSHPYPLIYIASLIAQLYAQMY